MALLKEYFSRFIVSRRQQTVVQNHYCFWRLRNIAVSTATSPAIRSGSPTCILCVASQRLEAMTSRTRPPTKSMTIASGDCEKEVRISWRPKTEVVEVVPGVFCAGSVSSNVVGAADAYSSVAECSAVYKVSIRLREVRM